MSEDRKTYLGDGVYAEVDGFNIWLYTDNGIEKSDRIALEPAVLSALNDFATHIRTASKP